MKKNIIFLLLSLSAAFAVQAQDLEMRKADLSFEQLYWHNPRATQANTAALTLFHTTLPELRNFSDLQLRYSHEGGDLRTPTQSPVLLTYGLQTQSIQRLKKTFLTGYFEYEIGQRRQVQWNSLFFPESNPFRLGDSVPGKFATETFKAGVGVAHPLTEKHSIGLSADYVTASGAKNKDLRNQNNYMDFRLSPSWYYQGGLLNFGLDLGWQLTQEKTEYRQIQEAVNLPFYRFYGLWFYQEEIFSGTTSDNVRMIQDNKYFGHLQVDLRLGSFSFYNQVGVSYRQSSQKNSSINNKQFGDVESLSYEYTGVLKFDRSHQVELRFNSEDLLGYRILQREEYDSKTNVNVWVTYDRFNNYASKTRRGGLMYSWLHFRDAVAVKSRLDVGADVDYRQQHYKLYPYLTTQKYNLVDVYARYTQHLKLGDLSSLSLAPCLAFSRGQGRAHERSVLSEQGSLQPSDTWQRMDLLMQEYDFLTAQKMAAQLELSYRHTLVPKSGMQAFAKVRGQYIHAFNTSLQGLHRTHLDVSLGITF